MDDLSTGSDRGFWLQMALLLGGIALVALFRAPIETAAAQPRAMSTLFGTVAHTLRADLSALAPGLVVGAITLLLAAIRTRRWWTGPVPVPRGHSGQRSSLALGRLRGSRRLYRVPPDATFDHGLILGRTRAGKSQHALSLALQDLDRGDCALVLIDPHDELCRSFVAAGYSALQKRPVIWLSFGDSAHVPGFNLLERVAGEASSAVAERLVDLVDWLFFAGASTDHERLSNNLRLAAWACASLGRSLLDCRVFLTDPKYRALAASQLGDAYLREAIREFNETLRHDPTFPQSAVNRLANLTDNEALRRIVGQETTFDLGAVLDHAGVLLVSLDEVALGEKGVYLLAGMLLHRIAGHLKRRPKDDATHRNPRVRIILDEAQRYQVGLLQGMVGELAGRGAAISLISQGLSQFAEPRMRSYLLNNVATYSVFTVADHEAEILARELFVTRANRVGLTDERGRPVHVLSIQEQLAEQKRCLTRQERRAFVALARGQPPGLCGSFLVQPAADSATVEQFRRECAARCGRPRGEVERTLEDRLRQARPGSSSTQNPRGAPAAESVTPRPGAHAEQRVTRVRSRRLSGHDRTGRAVPGGEQLRLHGMAPDDRPEQPSR
jgi:hypothetical protein